MSDDLVRIEGLVKRFGSFRALGGLDLEVAAGQILAIVHHNPDPARPDAR